MSRLAPFLLVVLVLVGCGVKVPDIAGNNAPPYTDPGTPSVIPESAGRPPSGCHLRGSGIYALPDPRCSPGATNPAVTQANVSDTICKSGWTRTVRPPESVTGPEKRLDMHAYGITGSSRQYELDHIISLELGGAPNSYRNFYPEPDYPHREGFYLNPKDRLENELNRLVCDGRMPLRVAQATISTDWVAAYHRYVG